MDKSIEELWKDFKKELEENDKKVKDEINKKTDEQKAKEFALFIKKNNCKVMRGGQKWKIKPPSNILP